MGGIAILRRGYVWGLLAALLFVIVAMSFVVGKESTNDIDRELLVHVQGWESSVLTPLMKSFSWLGSTMVVIVISVGIFFFLAFVLGLRKEMLLFVTAVGGAALLNKVLKHVFQRERPDFLLLIDEKGYSFPSGHSAAAAALYGIVIFLLWRHVTSKSGRALLIVIAIFMVLCIGISRIYLGVHYPSDVLGGYLVSGVWLGLSIEVFQRIRAK